MRRIDAAAKQMLCEINRRSIEVLSRPRPPAYSPLEREAHDQELASGPRFSVSGWGWVTAAERSEAIAAIRCLERSKLIFVIRSAKGRIKNLSLTDEGKAAVEAMQGDLAIPA
jgi:hypothetical protein